MQVEHKTENGTVLFLKIENDYSIAGLNDGHIYFWTSSLLQSMGDYPLCVEIPNGNFEYIGLTSEATEEKWSEIIDTAFMYKKHGVKSYKFRSYIDGFLAFKTAKESGESLMQHLQINESEKWVVLFKPKEK